VARPIRATISLAALRHNYAAAAAHRGAKPRARGRQGKRLRPWRRARGARPGARLRRLRHPRARGRACAFAIAAIRQPILLLEGFFAPEELPVLGEHDLATVVHCDEQLRMLEAARLARPSTSISRSTPG
jgi:alanine racemase